MNVSMRKLLICFITLYYGHSAVSATDIDQVSSLAQSNGYRPSKRVIEAIAAASRMYHINIKELTAIAIIETGLGTNVKEHRNSNGTTDVGLFQINTVNKPKCIEYNLSNPEGSAMCAAKLLWSLKQRRKDYLGSYHSKTPAKKAEYLKKVAKVLLIAADK